MTSSNSNYSANYNSNYSTNDSAHQSANHSPIHPDRHMSKQLLVVDRMREDFDETLQFQTTCLQKRIDGQENNPVLILVEHDPIYTYGRRALNIQGSIPGQPAIAAGNNTENQPSSKNNPDHKIRSTPWREVSRGGLVTYHGPGQLVAYPIFNLADFKKDVHFFLRQLEEVIIITLGKFGIAGFQREGFTGVWVNALAGDNSTQEGDNTTTPHWSKIASIGVAARQWVTYHGIAINLSPDLDYFRAISPCGGKGEDVTTIAQLCHEDDLPLPTLEMLKAALVSAFCEVFAIDLHQGVSQVSISQVGISQVGTFKKEAVDSMPPNGSQKVVTLRPSWLRAKAGGSQQFLNTQEIVRSHKLTTVCEEARCPNMGECWSHGTATFMIMGELCTRRCGFCSVKDGTLENLTPLDPFEPARVAQATEQLGLKHVVITSVDRDDLPDMGAEHFNRTVKAIKHLSPDCRIELLIPDMRGKLELVRTILSSGEVSILNHNIETVPRLYRRVRPGASLQRSLNLLSFAKELSIEFLGKESSCNTSRETSDQPVIACQQRLLKTKSGIMVGLGEKPEEVLEVLDMLRSAQVDIVTIGQYLQPSSKQLPVHEYITPAMFNLYYTEGMKRGFEFVESGPLVRSSYHAWKHTADDGQHTSTDKAMQRSTHEMTQNSMGSNSIGG